MMLLANGPGWRSPGTAHGADAEGSCRAGAVRPRPRCPPAGSRMELVRALSVKASPAVAGAVVRGRRCCAMMFTLAASCMEMPPPGQAGHVVHDHVVEDVRCQGRRWVRDVAPLGGDAAAVAGARHVALDAVTVDGHRTGARPDGDVVVASTVGRPEISTPPPMTVSPWLKDWLKVMVFVADGAVVAAAEVADAGTVAGREVSDDKLSAHRVAVSTGVDGDTTAGPVPARRSEAMWLCWMIMPSFWASTCSCSPPAAWKISSGWPTRMPLP